MKCPNCGKDLADGYLYCEECGGEIRIVPDFEPEFESEIHDTLSGLAEEIDSEHNYLPEAKEYNTENRKQEYFLWKKIKSTPYFVILSIACGSLLIVLSFILGTLLFRHYSYNYQVSEALKAGADGVYQEAIGHLERALSLSDDDNGAQILLADYYYKDGKIEDAISILQEYVLRWKEPIDGYRLLISIYENQNEYQKINELLLKCTDKETLNQFQKYMALPPEFGLKDSIYYEIVPLKLLGNSKGKIFYTLDGSEPTEKSKEYSAPVFLDVGNYKVKAIFINSYGIKSEIATKEFKIVVTKPYAPQVSLYSGTYQDAQTIEIEVQENCEVYYTTDGSEPTEASVLYVSPIKMPLGASHFRFVAINSNGTTGEVTDRRFHLFLQEAVLTPQQAIHKTIAFQIETRFITDIEGHSLTQAGRYQYTCSTAIKADGLTYYLVEESYVDPTETNTKTGNQFAIDIIQGSLNKAELNRNDEYQITLLK